MMLKSLIADDKTAYEISREIFFYAYPMILMNITKKQTTNFGESVDFGHGTVNAFSHSKKFADHTFHSVVRPNVDTLYSSAWLDLSVEPMILSVDTIERYYVLQLLDMWSDTFAAPGTRTTGKSEQEFALVGPSCEANPRKVIPDNIAIIRCPTTDVFLIGRIQTNGESDYQVVHKIQARMKLFPLSSYGNNYSIPKGSIDSSIDMKTPPVIQVEKMGAKKFFADFAKLLASNPPHQNDYSMVFRMSQLGFTPGSDFDIDLLPLNIQSAVVKALEDAKEAIIQEAKTIPMRSGWSISVGEIGTYGTNYLRRASVAYVGLGANQPEDAAYPFGFLDKDGNPLNGKNQYVLHFEKDKLPPVNAFWSVTMYGEDQFLVENEIRRYALGDRDKLEYNSDGSLTIYIQNKKPVEASSNWLPAPAGDFSLVIRLYWPKFEVLSKEWTPPSINNRDEREISFSKEK